MAGEISNRTLAILLVVAIAISLGGTILSLDKLGQISMPTGAATDTGTATINVTSQASIIFKVTSVDFGAGWVNSTQADTCEMTAVNTTDGSASTACIGAGAGTQWGSGKSGFVIENNGNVNLTVDVECNRNWSNFVGIPSGGFRFMLYNNETGSCNADSLNQATDNEWYSWPGNNSEKVNVCNSTGGGFAFADSKDSLVLDINVTIHYQSNMTGSAQTATITATGTSV